MFRIVVDVRTGAAQQVQMTPEEIAALPPPEPAPPRYIAKTTIYRRATDAEITTLNAALPNLPLRDRLMWQDAENGLVDVDEVLPWFVDAVGAERAAELLE